MNFITVYKIHNKYYVYSLRYFETISDCLCKGGSFRFLKHRPSKLRELWGDLCDCLCKGSSF